MDTKTTRETLTEMRNRMVRRGQVFENEGTKANALAAAIAALDKLAEYEEMMATADHFGGWLNGDHTWSIAKQGTGWLLTSDAGHADIRDTPLEAFKAIKEQK